MSEESHCPFRVLSTNIIDGKDSDIYDDSDEYDSTFDQMTKKAFLIWDRDPSEVAKKPPRRSKSRWYSNYVRGGRRIPQLEVEWITNPSEDNLDRSTTLTYGNEPSLKYFYHHLCVVAILNPKEFASLDQGRKKKKADAK